MGIPKNIKNLRDDHDADKERAEYLSGITYNESQQCERPNDTKGPLQCFEGEGYASKEKIIFNGAQKLYSIKKELQKLVTTALLLIII